MKFLTVSSFVLSALLLGFSQISARGFTLDAFTSFDANEDPSDLQAVDLSRGSTEGAMDQLTHNNLDMSTVFGGKREIKITKDDPDRGAISFEAFDGEAAFASDSRVHGTAEIIWDGHESAGTWVDIEANNQDSFELTVTSLIIGNEVDPPGGSADLNFHFEIRDTSNNFATMTNTLTSDINISTPLYFLYQDRVEDEGNSSNTNLGRIDYIRLYTSEENEGADYTFDLIQSSQQIPFEFSPTLGIIIGGSLIGFNIFCIQKEKIRGIDS